MPPHRTRACRQAGKAPRPDPTKKRYRSEHHLARYDENTVERLNLAA
jgi:hypothetical protein